MILLILLYFDTFDTTKKIVKRLLVGTVLQKKIVKRLLVGTVTPKKISEEVIHRNSPTKQSQIKGRGFRLEQSHKKAVKRSL